MSVLKTKLSCDFLRRSKRQDKLYSRLTPCGYGFVALVVVGFLMSMNFSNNLIFAMTFLLISIAIVGWWFTRLNLTSLDLGDWKVEPVFAGRDLSYKISVENRAGDYRYALAGWSKGDVQATEISVPRKACLDLLLQVKTVTRGMTPVRPAAIKSSFPLGIFEARRCTSELPKVIVFPAPIGSQVLPCVNSSADAHLLSEAGSYTDMKRYSPGDPLSRINWKAFARFDELYTKEFDGAQGQAALWITWDAVTCSGEEAILSQLCRWILDIHGAGREFGLEIPEVRIEPAHSEEHLLECLTELALYGETRKL